MAKLDSGYLIKGSLLFAVYFITARIGLGFDPVAGFATLVWLPTGISIAALFLLGQRYWPFVLLGAFSANFSTGATVPVALGIGIGNATEAFIAAYLLRTYVKLSPSFDRLRQTAGFITVILFAAIISATLGVISLILGGIVQAQSFGFTWLSWWIGNVVSGLVITPFILIWSKYYRTKLNLKRVFEYFVPGLFLLIVSLAVYKVTPIGSGDFIKYLVYPPLIWISLRFSPRITITSILFLTIVSVLNTVAGQSPFATADLAIGLFYLQSFIGITSATMLLLASASAENKYLERRKDEFISVASHELKNPLTSLKLGTSLLQKKFEKKRDWESFRQVKRINDQVDKTIRLAVNLLDIKSIHEEKIKLKKENFDLRDLAKEIIKDFSKSSKRKIELQKGNNISIFADKDKIGQVITNLLSNAIKYSPDNKKIIISTYKKGNENYLRVQDFGEGVSPDEQKIIFKRYYKVNKHKYTKDVSVGLGLYISKKIIESHGGKIWVESPSRIGLRKIKGSSFCFSLPEN